MIGFAACAHEFELHVAALELRRAVAAENRQMRAASKTRAHCLGKLDARADSDEIDIFRLTAYNQIAHISSHHIGLAAESIGSTAHGMEYAAVYFFLEIHLPYFATCKVTNNFSTRQMTPKEAQKKRKKGEDNRYGCLLPIWQATSIYRKESAKSG